MRDRFGAKDERSWKLRFHTQTAGVSLTAQQPYNNVVRTALQALAAVLGGTNSLHTNSLDEALALPTAEAATLALRTQQVIAYESGVTNTVDPLGGSYFIERLTLDMERGAREYFQTIDRLGGMVEAIEDGYPQREIAEASYKFQQAVEAREKVIVGVNGFVQEDEAPPPILYIDDTHRREAARRSCESPPDERQRRRAAVARCAAGCGSRPGQHDAPVARLRPRLRHCGRDVRCAPAGVGGISGSAAHLADSSELTADSSRMRKIRVVIAKPGLDGHDRGAKVIARALRDAGMEVIYMGLRQTPEQIVAAALQEDADAIGLSILSGAHMHICPRVLELLEARGLGDVLLVVGGIIPDVDIPKLREMGVKGIFLPGTPMQQIVEFIQANVVGG